MNTKDMIDFDIVKEIRHDHVSNEFIKLDNINVLSQNGIILFV